ncbi:hypothetical protein COCC4DRAFT_199125 [Bipolaris maydis ATCC 48331]|uniref:Uncharacterized protein n=2 Tax=Cochliobolus heterostrophus TaxID=5016 RepID=M2UT02_COCH5|nr:uncharacterized protein COCC4DRAFT_199125 [Bipolaris maydis ATCC 48331]EMD96726.1 hypothetical protein COCHEDRAFT_1123314 [Bipolaris maydis C5]KAH7558301.1 hypothetical protein BM1_05573 [Bipolaris maydis]ENI03594.1 hypothetical protein COCC4DRAFT_199125 [Bipolaris maydis ATCC 48331]KAJ5020846.1 hypothetical protein J3E73DRAFT_242250 [Bipolaris maydis]KAJ5031389.1 hypothetical protein J3E73DRAFT_266683 [Bipolaris maydis]
MATKTEPEIILYDLGSTKNVCFSPVVWRIRMMLNYKKLPYTTIFLEFPDIEPTLKELGIVPGPSAAGRYTVPAIHHVPTNTYLMDSVPIANFIETTYPEPPVPLTSELGCEIEAKARSVVGTTFRASVMPREMYILSPRAQEYFRRSREAMLGHPLEDLLDPEKEGQAWKAADSGTRALGELMLTNKADGPFVLGAKPSLTDFFVAGNLQTARMVGEDVFQRFMEYPGYSEIYEACLPFMQKRD